jgi:hypothetical protein
MVTPPVLVNLTPYSALMRFPRMMLPAEPAIDTEIAAASGASMANPRICVDGEASMTTALAPPSGAAISGGTAGSWPRSTSPRVPSNRTVPR